jgi:hypothetical protein
MGLEDSLSGKDSEMVTGFEDSGEKTAKKWVRVKSHSGMERFGGDNSLTFWKALTMTVLLQTKSKTNFK